MLLLKLCVILDHIYLPKDIPFPLNSKPTPSGCEFRENAVASDWTNNPVLTVY